MNELHELPQAPTAQTEDEGQADLVLTEEQKPKRSRTKLNKNVGVDYEGELNALATQHAHLQTAHSKLMSDFRDLQSRMRDFEQKQFTQREAVLAATHIIKNVMA